MATPDAELPAIDNASRLYLGVNGSQCSGNLQARVQIEKPTITSPIAREFDAEPGLAQGRSVTSIPTSAETAKPHSRRRSRKNSTSLLMVGLACVVGDEIHGVGFRILIKQIDGGRQNLIAQRQHGDSRFQAAGAAQQMSGHRFRRAYGNLARAKEITDRMRLQRVSDRVEVP